MKQTRDKDQNSHKEDMPVNDSILNNRKKFSDNLHVLFTDLDFFLKDYEILKRRVSELERKLEQVNDNIKNEEPESDLISITQIVREYGLTRPTIYKYKKLGVLKPVVKSPMMFERKNVERLVLAVRG